MARNSATPDSPAEVMTDRELAKAGQTDDGKGLVLAPSWDEDRLRSLRSFDDVAALFAETGIDFESADEVLGDGFTVINDKGILVGMPCMFLEWRINSGNMGEFVSARVVAKMPGGAMGKFIINDGSTGLKDQLKKYSQKTGRWAGLRVMRGLRRSDYEVEINGETRSATTFYLDVSAQ